MEKKIFNDLGNISGRRNRVPRSSGPSNARSFSDRRKIPRFRLFMRMDDEEKIFLKIGQNGKRYNVLECSANGLSFEMKENDFEKGLMTTGRIKAQIISKSYRLPIEIKPVHFTDGVVGCRIYSQPKIWSKQVGQYLIPSKTGSRLQKIKSDFVKIDTLKFDWYRAAPNCDFVVSYGGDNSVDLVQLYFNNILSEWSKEKGLQTSLLLSIGEDVNYFDSVGPIKFDGEPNFEVINVTRRIVRAANLPENLKKKFDPYY